MVVPNTTPCVVLEDFCPVVLHTHWSLLWTWWSAEFRPTQQSTSQLLQDSRYLHFISHVWKKFLMWKVLQVSVAEEGMRGLVRGWAPTAIGYSAQVIQFCKPCLISFKKTEFLLGSLQVWILWSFQDRLCQCFGRRECLCLQNWSVLGCICLRWVLCWYCFEPNGSLQSANSDHAWFPCHIEGWCTSYLPVSHYQMTIF